MLLGTLPKVGPTQVPMTGRWAHAAGPLASLHRAIHAGLDAPQDPEESIESKPSSAVQPFGLSRAKGSNRQCPLSAKGRLPLGLFEVAQRSLRLSLGLPGVGHPEFGGIALVEPGVAEPDELLHVDVGLETGYPLMSSR